MKLKPCPFCGEDEDISIRFDTYNGPCKDIEGHVYCYIECLPCDVRTGRCFEADAKHNGADSAKHMAMNAWNRRKQNER